MKYIVMDSRKDGWGDIFTKETDDRYAALAEADAQWSRLTAREKAESRICVLESVNPDEDACDHMDGNVIYSIE